MGELVTHPLVHGALLGFWTAFSVDLALFLKASGWKVEGFDFSVATKKWVSGAITGVLGALGLGLLS